MPDPLPNRIPTSALNDALRDFHPQNTAELVQGLRQRLDSLDDHAQNLLDTALASQRGEIARLDTPPVSLPPGAAQCPQAEYQRFANIDCISSGAVFTSSVSNCGLVSGKYMYEVIICTAGSLQIGFSAPMNMFLWDDRKGVGNFPFTVAYDGCKCKLLNVDSRDAGWEWSMGDTIGVTFDLDIGEVTYYQNGKLVTSCSLPTIKSMMAAGVPHSDKDVELCYFPAISMAPWQEFQLNMGGFPFMYPIEGFKPIDATFECLYTTWIPRLGTLDLMPAHLLPYKNVVASVILQRLMEDTEATFMDFGGCVWEYTWMLNYKNRERADALLDLLRTCMGEDMFMDMMAAFISCTCAYSSATGEGTDGWITGAFRIPLEGVEDNGPFPCMPNPCLVLLDWIIDVAPDSVHRWCKNFGVMGDIMNLADLKVPNERDLEDLFPHITEEDLYAPASSRKLYAAQQAVANAKIKPDEIVKHRIFCKLIADSGFRAQVTTILQTLVTEIREAAKDPTKRITHRTYSERMVTRLFFHITFAVSEPNNRADEKTAADVMCPLSVLKMPCDYPVFSGMTREAIMGMGGAPDFSNVATVNPHSPECLMFTLCELYMLVVKGFLVTTFNEMVANNVARKRYSAARQEEEAERGVGVPPSTALASMREVLVKTTRGISWTVASLFLSGFHRDIFSYASLTFKMINHYAETPYARLIPIMFIECATDLVHFCRKTCPHYSVLITVEPIVPLFYMTHFRSPIIHYQPTREYILMTVGGLVDMHEEHRRQLATIIRHNLPIVFRFYAQVIDQFSNTMAWTLVAGMLFRLNSGNGFCMTEKDESIQWTTVFQQPDPIPAEGFTAYLDLSKTFVEYFTTPSVWEDELPDSSPLSFLRSAITHSNWCVTELSSVLAATDPKEQLTKEVKQRRQRGASIFDYTVKILHILEYIITIGFTFYFNTTDNNAGTVPSHNAPPISASSKALLVVELVGQCLSRFAFKDSALIRIAALELQGYESWRAPMVIAPIVGNLMALLGPKESLAPLVDLTSHLTAEEAMMLWRDRHNDGFDGIPASVIAYVEELVRTNVFFRQMAQPRVDWNHACVTYALTGIDWAEVCRKAHSNSNLLKALPLTAMAYEALQEERMRRTGQLDAKMRLITHPHPAAVGAAVADEDDADGAALCPICCVSSLEVVFEPCGHSSCLPCIERHQISDRRCFFCKVDVVRVKEISPSAPEHEQAASFARVA